MAKNTNQIVTLEDFKVTNLAEFQGKREQQEQLVKDNPYIEITDTESFETAKKHRTALVTGRTTLAKEKTSVSKRIKEIIVEPVSKAYDELISITTPHEEKQQEEVKRYEAVLEEKRLAKQRAEQERVQAINQKIDNISNVIFDEINSLTYEASLTYEVKPTYDGAEVGPEHFEEYGSRFTSEMEALKFKLEQRKSVLAAEEKNRLDAIEIQKQREEQNRIDAIKAAIFNFNSKWQHIITNLQENQIKKTVEGFNSLVHEDYQEFNQEYETTKQQIELSLNNRIAQINQQIELDKQQAAYEQQQKEMRAMQRRAMFAALGFDYTTLTYSNFGLELSINESELETDQYVFNKLLEATQQRIFEASQPKQEPVEEVNQEIQSDPAPVVSENIEFQPEPIIKSIEYSKNQLRSIDFIKGFVQYSEQNISTPIDINITNYVLQNVK